MAHKNSAGLPDASHVGHVTEITGQASVTHADGVTETITNGTAIYQSDIIETDATGAVNISFIDDTSFAVSEGARLVIDEYIYDPQTQSGETNFSVLKGVFVFTSGLIGRDDPDDVKIETPAGSIGIRGTIIAGNVDSGEITVVEGAIVLTDHSGHEMTLATQFETARFHNGEGIENIGQLTAKDIGEKFFVVSQVSPTLFPPSMTQRLRKEQISRLPIKNPSLIHPLKTWRPLIAMIIPIYLLTIRIQQRPCPLFPRPSQILKPPVSTRHNRV
jgi:hypothetical protein